MIADESRMRSRRVRCSFACGVITIMAAATSPLLARQDGARAVTEPDAPRGLVPRQVRLGEAGQSAIDAAWLTDEERAAARVFHGVWDERDLTTPSSRAWVALNAWDFNHPSLEDPAAPVELRAEALVRQGALHRAIDLLAGAESATAARIRAEALEGLGDLKAADEAVDAVVSRMLRVKIEDAAELTESVRALFLRARVEGQPARDFQTMLDLLGRAHQELDRLHWPARLAEAELLLEKDNAPEAVAALHEVLALNPRCAQAWYMLGLIAIDRFDFESAQVAAQALRRLNPEHPLAALLGAELSLVQDDPQAALDVLVPLTTRWPQLREAHALIAAAHALLFDDRALAEALDRFDRLSPGSAIAQHAVGRHLSQNRQYEAAAAMLEDAIARRPAWPAPRIELGLLELQSGRDARALTALREVVRLDPFNKRAANSLHLLEDLGSYARLESPHFIVRYQPGVDEVLAEMMLGPLERIHETVSTRFAHEPDRKTVIELLPDHEKFAVRITGMPHIHTIAACTGPVIAMEAPREGSPARHRGPFDWPRVLQHEYTHTITLSQTRNRIPHWLTEAAAVSMELAPRDYDRCLMLAHAWETGALFDLDEINWAFVRPRKPGDRALAYAQGHWMVEFMNERFGMSALVRLIERYFDGVKEAQAIPEALGVSREQFHADFLVWAADEVKRWGLAAKPTMVELTDELRESDPALAEFMKQSRQARLDTIAQSIADRIGRPATPGEARPTANRWPEVVRPPVEIDDDTLARWMNAYPDHPDLLELFIRRRIDALGAPSPADVPLLERYAALRPVDSYPDKKLAQVYANDPAKAAIHLERLDAHEQKSPVYALELARTYRALGRMNDAIAKVTRAVNINPYDARNRELAAAIALEADDLPLARQHIRALALLEPNRPQHQKRLERIDQLMAARPPAPVDPG
jgi:tetratricopeptide (TPR) repeat protein